MIENLPLTIGDIIKLFVFAFSTVGAMLGIMVKVLGAFKKYTDAIEKKISDYENGTDLKRRRIYERLDEVKKSFDDKYVSKDIFQLMNDNYMRSVSDFKKELDEVKHDVKVLIARGGQVQ